MIIPLALQNGHEVSGIGFYDPILGNGVKLMSSGGLGNVVYSGWRGHGGLGGLVSGCFSQRIIAAIRRRRGVFYSQKR